MNVTTQRRCLGMLAAGLLAGSVGAVGWSVSGIPTELEAASPSQSMTPPTEVPIPTTSSPPDESFAARRLRQPLYDPPAPAPTPAPPKTPAPRVVEAPPPRPPKLDVTLVGTLIESDKRLAIVADASGEFDVKGIGENLELSPLGITVEKIESERVTLRYQGRESTIELDRTAVEGSVPGGNRGGVRRRNNR